MGQREKFLSRHAQAPGSSCFSPRKWWMHLVLLSYFRCAVLCWVSYNLIILPKPRRGEKPDDKIKIWKKENKVYGAFWGIAKEVVTHTDKQLGEETIKKKNRQMCGASVFAAKRQKVKRSRDTRSLLCRTSRVVLQRTQRVFFFFFSLFLL